MTRRQLTKILGTAAMALSLLSCHNSPAKSEVEKLPSYDDLVGYIKDGTFTERYIPKPHRISKVIYTGNTFFTHKTPNAAAEFERYIRLYSNSNFSGLSLYTDNYGGVPYEERDDLKYPDTYRGNYFRYRCPVSDTLCQYDPARVERITPKEWEDEFWGKPGKEDRILIPISDYADAENPAAVLSVGRTDDGSLLGMTLSKARKIGPFDLIERSVGSSDSVLVRYLTYSFITKSLEIIK